MLSVEDSRIRGFGVWGHLLVDVVVPVERLELGPGLIGTEFQFKTFWQ